MPSPTTFWQSRFPRLRYAIVWLAFAWMRCIVWLPLRWQHALGRFGGRIGWRLAARRREIVDINLATCFPEWTAEERRRVCRQHFEALGIWVTETAMGWYGKQETIERHVRFEGLEHLAAGLAAGNGVVLYSAHFTTFEFLFPALKPHCPRLTGMYKLQRNPLMNEIMNAGRGRSVDRLFAKDNVRDLLRELERNSVVWYASDQKFAGKSSSLIPFFGEPAMTNTAISRIAARTGAVVLPYFCRRLPGPTPQYLGWIGAPLPDFRGEDPVADVRGLVAQLEDFIRECPEQYWWIHQRFSGRPDHLPDIYAKGAAAR